MQCWKIDDKIWRVLYLLPCLALEANSSVLAYTAHAVLGMDVYLYVSMLAFSISERFKTRLHSLASWTSRQIWVSGRQQVFEPGVLRAGQWEGWTVAERQSESQKQGISLMQNQKMLHPSQGHAWRGWSWKSLAVLERKLLAGSL